jgi:hypothetical protein
MAFFAETQSIRSSSHSGALEAGLSVDLGLPRPLANLGSAA